MLFNNLNFEVIECIIWEEKNPIKTLLENKNIIFNSINIIFVIFNLPFPT